MDIVRSRPTPSATRQAGQKNVGYSPAACHTSLTQVPPEVSVASDLKGSERCLAIPLEQARIACQRHPRPRRQAIQVRATGKLVPAAYPRLGTAKSRT